MKVLILGGGGVFALHFARYMLEQNSVSNVISVGRSPVAISAFSLDVGDNDARYEYHQIHITFEHERLWELIEDKKPNLIVNFAALAYATSWDRAQHYYDTNVTAVAKIVDKLQHVDWFDRFIQIGTSELYGSVDKPACEYAPLNPTSPYAVSKLAADMHLNTMFNVRQFPMNILRPSNAYGPGQLLYRIMPKAIYSGLNNIQMPLEGGGKVRKSFMHATDIARALLIIYNKAQMGETYNVGPENPITIKEIVNKIAIKFNKSLEEFIKITDGRIGEDMQYWLNSDKIKKIGYSESINIDDGIEDMFQWGMKYKSSLPKPDKFILRA